MARRLVNAHNRPVNALSTPATGQPPAPEESDGSSASATIPGVQARRVTKPSNLLTLGPDLKIWKNLADDYLTAELAKHPFNKGDFIKLQPAADAQDSVIAKIQMMLEARGASVKRLPKQRQAKTPQQDTTAPLTVMEAIELAESRIKTETPDILRSTIEAVLKEVK